MSQREVRVVAVPAQDGIPDPCDRRAHGARASARVAGILGALLAIPVAGALLAVGRELLLYRKELAEAGAGARPAGD